MTLSLVAQIFALVLFIVAGSAVPQPHPWHSRLVCYGLAFFVLSFILMKIPT